MTFDLKMSITPLIVAFVLPGCALCPDPVYDPTLDPTTLTQRDAEAQIYDIIQVSPTTWALMTDQERQDVLEHNCVFALRNPEAAPPGFDAKDCGQ